MKTKHNIFLLTEDWQLLQDHSRNLSLRLADFFIIRRIRSKRSNIDYVQLISKHRTLRKRSFLHLIHQFHIVACESYRLQDFNLYLVYDSIMQRLIYQLYAKT